MDTKKFEYRDVEVTLDGEPVEVEKAHEAPPPNRRQRRAWASRMRKAMRAEHKAEKRCAEREVDQ